MQSPHSLYRYFVLLFTLWLPFHYSACLFFFGAHQCDVLEKISKVLNQLGKLVVTGDNVV